MELVYRLCAFLVLLVAAVLLGLYLGRVSVGDDPIVTTRTEPERKAQTPTPAAEMGEPTDMPAEKMPPLFFFPGPEEDGDWEVVAGQVSMAAEANVDQYVVSVSLGWDPEQRPQDEQRYNAALERYVALNSRARFLIRVDLNPPAQWFEQFPEAAMRINGAAYPYPSPTSEAWRNAAEEALAHLVATVESGGYGDRVKGYILCALYEKRWMFPTGHDVSRTNQRGFRQWLKTKYRTDDALQSAWADAEVTLETASIPERPDFESAETLFVQLPELQSVVDFTRYTSEAVADTIAAFAAFTAHITTLDASTLIAAPYGYTFETIANDSGHFGLEVLLESDLNALFAPVSYVDRGLGGVGGPMGPVDSMTVRGKKWFVIDDTRTGVERDPATGTFGRITGINAEDVYEVQRRNFAMTLAYGLGLVWADPQGEGWLHDSEQWAHFERLADVYAERLQLLKNDEAQNNDEAVLTVVVDESARFYLQCNGRMKGAMLQKGRDAALRSGVSVRFHLLREVLEDTAPPTPVYLFLNAFCMTASERARLHARLAREEASAIWLYAPGYIDADADVANIAATTGMDVRMFEEPVEGGSAYLLSGQYMRADERFGLEEMWTPAFYIAPEEETDFLARYVHDEEKGSVAIVTLPEGWTSVYIAEPELTPALLCEILQLLELHIFSTPVERAYHDALFARGDIVALHARQSGKRSVHFGGFYDIQDLLDPDIGWPQKDSVMLSVRTGETRLLRKSPLGIGAQ